MRSAAIPFSEQTEPQKLCVECRRRERRIEELRKMQNDLLARLDHISKVADGRIRTYRP